MEVSKLVYQDDQLYISLNIFITERFYYKLLVDINGFIEIKKSNKDQTCI